jgi:hypothetical protein
MLEENSEGRGQITKIKKEIKAPKAEKKAAIRSV